MQLIILHYKNLFYILKTIGTMFIKKEIIKERLSIIIFPLKSDNNISLQLANFIPNFLDKEFFRKNKNYFQSNAINMKLYDGKIGTKDKFGFKKVNYLLEK